MERVNSIFVDKAGGSMDAPLHCLRNATGLKNISLPQIISRTMYNISFRNTCLNKSRSNFLVYIYMYIYIKKNRSIMILKKHLTHLDRIVLCPI